MMTMGHKHKYKPQKSKRFRNTVPVPQLTYDEVMQLCDMMSARDSQVKLTPIMLEPLSHSEKKRSSRRKSQKRLRNRKLQKKRGCSTPHKVPHASKHDAEEAMVSQMRTMRPGHELPVRVYFHDGKGGCGFWHTTSISEARQEKIVAQRSQQHTEPAQRQAQQSQQTQHPLFVALQQQKN